MNHRSEKITEGWSRTGRREEPGVKVVVPVAAGGQALIRISVDATRASLYKIAKRLAVGPVHDDPPAAAGRHHRGRWDRAPAPPVARLPPGGEAARSSAAEPGVARERCRTGERCGPRPYAAQAPRRPDEPRPRRRPGSRESAWRGQPRRRGLYHYRPAGIWKAHRPAATLRRTNDAPAFGYDILRGLAAHEIVGYPQL